MCQRPRKTKEDVKHTSVLFTGTINLPNSAFCISKTTIPISTKFTYRTVKNFGGQKVWRKGLLQGIGGKNFGEKVCVVSVQSSIRNKRRATF